MSETTRGRPRRAGADEAILAAVTDLLRRHGYAGLSVEDVATAAGVGRQSVYRRWPTKALLVVAAMATFATEPPPDTGSLAGDVRELVARTRAAYVGTQAATTAEVHAAVAADAAARERFEADFTAPRRAALAAVLERAGARGELTGDVDVTVVHDLLAGPFLHHALLAAPSTEPPADQADLADLAAAVTRAVLAACGAETRPDRGDA